MDNMLKMKVEEWGKRDFNVDEYFDSYIENIYNTGTRKVIIKI
jgi:hypothetical protein